MKLALRRAIALITPARIASGATPAERRLITSDSANTVHILVIEKYYNSDFNTPLPLRHRHQRPILKQNTQQHRIHCGEHQRIRDAGHQHRPRIAVEDVERQRIDDHGADEVGCKHAAPQPVAGAQMRKLLPAQAPYKADGSRAQRDERIDGIARQHAADDVGHHAHDKARPRPKKDTRQHLLGNLVPEIYFCRTVRSMLVSSANLLIVYDEFLIKYSNSIENFILSILSPLPIKKCFIRF